MQAIEQAHKYACASEIPTLAYIPYENPTGSPVVTIYKDLSSTKQQKSSAVDLEAKARDNCSQYELSNRKKPKCPDKSTLATYAASSVPSNILLSVSAITVCNFTYVYSCLPFRNNRHINIRTETDPRLDIYFSICPVTARAVHNCVLYSYVNAWSRSAGLSREEQAPDMTKYDSTSDPGVWG